MTHYNELDYSVNDVGASESYDVLALRGGEEPHIEVKRAHRHGRVRRSPANGVTHDRADVPTDLVVVAEIEWHDEALSKPGVDAGDHGTTGSLPTQTSPWTGIDIACPGGAYQTTASCLVVPQRFHTLQ